MHPVSASLRGANCLTLGMPSANALWLGDARLRLARPICAHPKQFPTPYHFSGWTASPVRVTGQVSREDRTGRDANRWLASPKMADYEIIK